MQEALTALQAGDTSRAEAVAKSIIRSNPQHEGARVLLARAQRAQGLNKQALQSCKDNVKAMPQSVALRTELALAQRACGRTADAEQSYRQVLLLDPAQALAMHNLANLLQARGALDEALGLYRRALALSPQMAQAHYELGNVLSAKGEMAQAMSAWQAALLIQPALAPAWFSLGRHLQDTNASAAIQALQKGLNIDSNNAEALALLSKLLSNAGRATEAEQCARMALSMAPDLPLAHYALGLSWCVQGRLADAMTPLATAAKLSTDHALMCEAIYLQAMSCLERGLISQGMSLATLLLGINTAPQQLAVAQHLLGALLFESGRTTEARAHFAQAMALSPGNTQHPICYCATSAYGGDVDGAGQKALAMAHIAPINPHVAEVTRAAAVSAAGAAALPRLRIGFLSGDFRIHSCAFFLEPLLQHIDQSCFELFAYDTGARADHVTQRLRQWISHWRGVTHMKAGELAQTIAQDKIDVLVDLAGLTNGGRIEALAAQPAPVQINWLGFLATTGHPAIQRRLTDALVDGPQQAGLSTEIPLHLERCYVCYQPPADAPEVADLPMLSGTGPTFGSFNALTKLSDDCIDLWVQVLKAVPDARLLIKTKALSDEAVRQYTIDRFTARGVAADRIELLGWAFDTQGHLGLYRRVDVALDTTPYNGVTTTCEALWMGVPVVSLVGQTYSSRQGLSLLTAVGRPEWAAHSEANFVQVCAGLVSDADALSALRHTLRASMSSSSLTDGAAFARAFEAAMHEAINRPG
jgi:protein O-GlcNAc transferase